MVDSSSPWYDYPRVDNFGTIDPQGNYWKPDSNIQTPYGYPVTAMLPGTVTSVQNTTWGQDVVTILLDRPLNSLATHEFFEHMGSANVSVGQKVSGDTLVGYTNLQGQGAPLGYGLYPGDIFGSGTAWGIDQQDLSPSGAGLLNPTALLDSAAGGSIPTSTGASGAGGLITAILESMVGNASSVIIMAVGIIIVLVGLAALIWPTAKINILYVGKKAINKA